MAQTQFAVRDFFRHCSAPLLESYFRQQNLFLEVDFSKLTARHMEPLMSAWNALPEKQQTELEADLSAVHELCNAKGLSAIQDALRTCYQTRPEQAEILIQQLADMEDHYTQAMTVYLDHNHIWRWVQRLHQADCLGHWRKRANLAPLPAATDEASLHELEQLLRAYFTVQESRGRHCKVEHYRRLNRDYFFAYPEDHATRNVEWEGDDMDLRAHHPAFEVVFLYNAAEGWLEMFYRGTRKATDALRNCFARAILKQPRLPNSPKQEKVFDLEPLRDRAFKFSIPANSPVEELTVNRLRLSSIHPKSRRIIVEADSTEDRQAVYRMLDQIGLGVNLSHYLVTQVQLHAKVWPDDGGPARSVTFQVSFPDSCNLKHEGVHRRLREVLAASGIEPRPVLPKGNTAPASETNPA